MSNGIHKSRRMPFAMFVSLLFTLLFSNIAFAQDPDGATLFKANCASCHRASSELLTGPGLKGVLGRIPAGDWKYKWVKNSQALVGSGDGYAKTIFAKYKTVMPAQALSEKEIDAILTWADAGPDEPSGNAPVGAVCPDFSPRVEEGHSSVAWFTAIIISVLMIILIAALRYARLNLRSLKAQKEGKPAPEERDFMDAVRDWMNNHKRLVAVIGLTLVFLFLRWGWYALKDIGVYAHEVHPNEWVGYRPSQPINFSHRIHAGDNKIACQYCHSGVEKSKTAGIPSANVCMNCHKAITKGTCSGDVEIKKIYAAVGWDGTAMHPEKAKPIVWNKVHVLPDFVFFSHQQHVKVGKLDCDNCHGDVKTMDWAEQQRPLTMGWCIKCHQETNVDMGTEGGKYKGNQYYEALHETLKKKYKGKDKFTVENIGGLECGRCHY